MMTSDDKPNNVKAFIRVPWARVKQVRRSGIINQKCSYYFDITLLRVFCRTSSNLPLIITTMF